MDTLGNRHYDHLACTKNPHCRNHRYCPNDYLYPAGPYGPYGISESLGGGVNFGGGSPAQQRERRRTKELLLIEMCYIKMLRNTAKDTLC